MLDHFFLKLLMTIHSVWPQVLFREKRVGAFAVVGAGGWVVLANLKAFLVGGRSGLQREVTCMERRWRNMEASQTPSTGLRHPSFNHCRV